MIYNKATYSEDGNLVLYTDQVRRQNTLSEITIQHRSDLTKALLSSVQHHPALSTNDYFQDMQLPEGTDHEYPSIPAISDQLPEMLLSNEGKGFRLTNFPDFPLQLFRI